MNSDLSAPAALAETLLREWEARTRPAPTPAYQAARPLMLAQLADLCQLLLQPADINVTADDVREVLLRATTIGLGTTVAHGSGRAARVAAGVTAAIQTQQLGPAPTGNPVSSLLSISSSPDCELEMDELTQITETVQTTFAQDMEMVFGHDISPDLTDSELRVWLLVGYAAAEETAATASSITLSN